MFPRVDIELFKDVPPLITLSAGGVADGWRGVTFLGEGK